jgi:hypothetical protein
MSTPNYEGKAQGMAAAEAGVTDEWKAQALAAVAIAAEMYQEFTSDEVWLILESNGYGRPETPAAMGPVMRKACIGGLIRKTGRYRVSTQHTNHAREVAVWASDLFYITGEVSNG